MQPPELTVIVVAYRMASQLANTLFTLSASYQRAVKIDQYEVIVVENDSEENLDPVIRKALPENFRYFHRQESRPTPSHALAFGLARARADKIALMVDGAHMLTPGVLANAMEILRNTRQSMVAVPVYHLGEEEQNISALNGYDEKREREILSTIDWRRDGYELFRVGCWCSANRNGFLQPLMESNMYATTRDALDAVAFDPAQFELPGGGAMNLHLFRHLGLSKGSRYYVLPGEGSFHQYHNGVTSSRTRDSYRGPFTDQLNGFWPGGFQALRRNPHLHGQVPPQAVELFAEAARLARRRAQRFRKLGKPLWPDDEVV